MLPVGQLFTAGIWLVKEGKEAEFIAEWSRFADWTSKSHLGAGTAHLLQDAADARRFLSFGPWESAEAIDRWRHTPELKSFLASARELCDEIQPRTLSLVALSQSPPSGCGTQFALHRWPPDTSVEPPRPAAANRVRDTFPTLTGWLTGPWWGSGTAAS